MADNMTITDRATIIMAGLLANPELGNHDAVNDPADLATKAVEIAHAVHRAAKENPNIKTDEKRAANEFDDDLEDS